MDKISLQWTSFRVCFLVLATLQLCQSNPAIDKTSTLIDANAPNSMEVQASNTNHTQSRQIADPEFDLPMYPSSRPSSPYPYRRFRPKNPSPTREPEKESFWSYLNPVTSLKKLIEIISGETEDAQRSPKPPSFAFRRPAFTESLRRNNPSKPQTNYTQSSIATMSNNASTTEEVTLPADIQARIIDQIMASLTTESNPPVQGNLPFPKGSGAQLTDVPQSIAVTSSFPTPNLPVPVMTPHTPNNAVFPFPTAPSLVAVHPIPDLEFRSLIPLLESGVLP